MSFVSLNNSACNDYLLDPQSEFSKASNRKENVECAVRPPTNNNDAIDAILDEAIVTTICLRL